MLNSILEYIGIEKDRINFSWISASEGDLFAKVIDDVTQRAKQLGPAKRFVKRVGD